MDSIDLYVWSVVDGAPVVHLYDINPRSKSHYLRQTFTDPAAIKKLTVDPYIEDDDSFSKVYDEICKVLAAAH